MKREFFAWMDGELPENAQLTDIQEQPPDIRRSVVSWGDGAWVAGERHMGLTVKLSFLLPEPEPVKRQRQAENLNRWCRGEILTLSTRPGLFLRVKCTGWPRLLSAGKWTDPVTAVFTAHEEPWWQTEEKVRLTMAGTERTGSLIPPGTADGVPVEAEVVNTSGTVCSLLVLKVGESLLRFSGLGLASGEALIIRGGNRGLTDMVIEGSSGTRAVYDKLQAASDDMLYAQCGQENEAAVASTVPVQVTLTARGRYR